MTIHAIVRNGDFSTNLVFPMRDNAMQDRLDIIGVSMEDATSVYVSEILTPAELQWLSKKHLNLDELNYLAKRMDSFSAMEMEQFYAAMAQQRMDDLKSLINLTFNLDKFTLIQNVSNMSAVGRAFLLIREGALPARDQDNPRYAAVGRELLQSGKGIATDHGLLFVADEPMEEVYDGRSFPEYQYQDSFVRVTINYEDQEETIYLPDDDLAITKAVHRIGADIAEDCDVRLEDLSMGDGWEERLDGILQQDGLYAANALLRAVQENHVDTVKLEAVAEYMEVGSVAALTGLIQYIDEFYYMEGADTPEEVGRWLIENNNDYELGPGLDEFFDFDAFGESIAEECRGRFLGSDFVCFCEYCDPEEIEKEIRALEKGETMEMTM